MVDHFVNSARYLTLYFMRINILVVRSKNYHTQRKANNITPDQDSIENKIRNHFSYTNPPHMKNNPKKKKKTQKENRKKG